MGNQDKMYLDLPVLGEFTKENAVQALTDLGEDKIAERIQKNTVQAKGGGGIFDSIFKSDPEPWMFTTHTFGFLPAKKVDGEKRKFLSAGEIPPDATLKNGRINVTLNRLRIASYPGSGEHSILFDFYAQNQIKGGSEDVHFNSTFRARDNSEAGIVGYPIFLGLSVGAVGVSFKCFTVNVKNKDDESFLNVLESNVFKKGLQLVTTAQPALAPLSELAVGITKNIAKRNRNVPVQDFYMGLDFGGSAMGARLAQGDYIAVQIPDKLQQNWEWGDYEYNTSSGQIIKTADQSRIPYNYVGFGVTKYEGD